MADVLGVPRPVGLLAAVMRLGRTLRIDDITRDERFAGFPARHPAMGPFLGVVVRHESEVIGHLFLAKSPGAPPFSEQDTRAVELLAAFAGAAIENAKLYAALHREVVAREDLLSMVSHDLRNPLAVVYTAARILQVASNVGGRERDQVDVIARNAMRMDRMIADLLTAAKVHEGRLPIDPRPQALAPIVAESAEALSSLAAKTGVELHVEVPKDLVVVCDAERVVQALCNLVGNALKFTPRGGAIVVSARASEASREALVSVRDTGSGIAPEDIPHLFDRFWQAKAHASRGTGLGLFITKGIVESHGGRIDVTSRVGEGSEFRFTLPLAAVAHESEPLHH
jgi:signal transduction histidine kinase